MACETGVLILIRTIFEVYRAEIAITTYLEDQYIKIVIQYEAT